MKTNETVSMIEVCTSGIKYLVDPEKAWREFIAQPFSEQLETACFPHHWIVQLHRIDLPLEARERFWKSYREPAAEKARNIAINGLCRVNYEKERDLLNAAIWGIEGMEQDRSSEPWASTLGEQVNSFGHIGMQFAELVAAGDHKAIARMAAIVKAGATPATDKPRGGEDGRAGELFREFCQFHRNTRSLPTKKQLRELCGMSDEIADVKSFGKLLKQLGLDGLPQALKSP